MDDTDFKILKILQEKARIPNVEVARTIGMAPSAVLERIKKLESKGIIAGYELKLNPEFFNHSMIAFVYISFNTFHRIEEKAKVLSKYEEIQEIHYISGEDCLLLKVRISNGTELQTFITDKISAVKGVKSIKSSISLATYKESSLFPISYSTTC